MDDYIFVPNHGAIGPQNEPSMWIPDCNDVTAAAEKWGGGNVANGNEAGGDGQLMYDPPSGWQYGFPKKYAPLENEALTDTFVRDGYPRQMAEDFGAKRCRFFGANDNTRPVAPATRRGPYIGTYTGRFYMTDPRPEDFCIEDIAHGLSRICRYTGACDQHLSVAEHSVHICDWLLETEGCKRLALIGLLHDAPEALSGFGDVARPSKGLTPVIKETEGNIWRIAVAPKFGLPAGIPAIVHEVDSRIIADEMTQNMNECDPAHNNPLGIRLQFWSPAFAKAAFLMRFSALTVGAREERSVA